MNRTSAALVLVTLLCVACGGSGSSKPDFAEPFDAAVMRMDAAAPSGDDAGVVVECPSSQMMCEGVCATLATDAQNCGACGNECAAGLVCVAGACTNECGTGSTYCGMGDGGAPDGGAPYCAQLASDNQNCGACGNACATGSACVAGACESHFTDTQSIVTWTAPATASYDLVAAGAAGGGGNQGDPTLLGGAGAIVSARFALTAGATLQILVGKQGNNGFVSSGAGGGGGSFVVSGGIPLLVAGGGGGGGPDGVGLSASLTTSGSAGDTGGAFPSGAGGTGGGGAGNGGNSGGGGGAGWDMNGATCLNGSTGGAAGDGIAFTNGGTSTSCAGQGPGGFGGGGAGYVGGGGGGGYSGGGASEYSGGGGGGSFVAASGTMSAFVLASSRGDGSVKITLVR